jgi:hypothetical protein
MDSTPKIWVNRVIPCWHAHVGRSLNVLRSSPRQEMAPTPYSDQRRTRAYASVTWQSYSDCHQGWAMSNVAKIRPYLTLFIPWLWKDTMSNRWIIYNWDQLGHIHPFSMAILDHQVGMSPDITPNFLDRWCGMALAGVCFARLLKTDLISKST